MSDFLQSLIVRNRFASNAAPAALQPRLPSLFENPETTSGTAQPLEIAVDLAGSLSTARFQPRGLTAQPEPTPSSEPDLHSQGSHPDGSRLSPANRTEMTDQAATKTIRLLDEVAPRGPVPGMVHQDQAPVSPAASRPNPVRSQTSSSILPALPQPDSSFRPMSVSAPKPASTHPMPARRVEPAEPETTLHVRIGRIDVRAVTASTPSQTAQRAPKPKPGLSLDDYLKQRSEGKR